MAVLRAEGMPAACLHLPWGGAASPCPPGAALDRHGLASRTDRNEPSHACVLECVQDLSSPLEGGLRDCILILQRWVGHISGSIPCETQAALQF